MLRETCTVILSFTFKTTLRHVRTGRRRAASSLLLLHLRHRLRSVMCAARRRLRVNPSDAESRDNFHRWRRSRCITSSFQRPNHTGCCTPPHPSSIHLYPPPPLMFVITTSYISLDSIHIPASFNLPPLLSAANGTAAVFGDKMLYAQGPR